MFSEIQKIFSQFKNAKYAIKMMEIASFSFDLKIKVIDDRKKVENAKWD